MELLNALWGDHGGRKCIMAIKGEKVKPFFFPDAGAAAETIEALRKGGADVYFTPGVFGGDKRTAENLLGIGALFLDIDCGAGKPYADWKQGLLATLRWLHAAQFYKPNYIVRSGGGLHVYWLLDGLYSRQDWLPVAQHLKQAVAVTAGGLRADPAVTADAARVLRVPGTVNSKNGNEVRETCITRRRLTLEEFRERLPQVGPVALPSGPRPAAEWSVSEPLPLGDAPAIAAACAQMHTVREKAGAVSEPLWRAALSVVQRCADAPTHVAAFSEGDPRYDPQEALNKAARTGGPATCAHFDDVNPGGCEGCPHAGKITSPIQLGVAPAEPPAGEKYRSTVGRFTVTDEGVYFSTPVNELGEGGELVRVTTVPLWVEEVRERSRVDTEAGASQLLLCWRNHRGEPRKGVMPQRDLYEPRALKAWLADYNVISAVREVKFMAEYITQYTAAMLRERGARQYYDTLGWHGDGFVLGKTIVTKAGAHDALVQAGNPIGKLQAKGSLAAWKNGIDKLAEPQYWQHAFAVLAGFGSPLLDIVGVQSAVVSLVGPSGAGKTICANAALSIYGDYQALGQGASASINAWEKQLGCNRHVPYLLDEVTQYSTKLLTTFLYMAANGQGKSTLTRNRDTREAGSWRLVPFITSNHPVLDFDQTEVEEAHRRRLLELTFTTAMDSADGALLDSAISNNHGVAAVPYLEAVSKLRDHIPVLFEAATKQLREQCDFPDANRFVLWTLAAAVVGGNLAKRLGIINIDVGAVVSRVAAAAAGQASQTFAADERASEFIREWLTMNSRRICLWGGDRHMGELVDDPIARVCGDTVLVHRSELNKALREARIPLSQLGGWWRAAQASEPCKQRLAPGTPALWCYALRAGVVGFTENDIDSSGDQQ